MNKSFVFVKGFHYEGDVQFGVLNREIGLYVFGDGDGYTVEDIAIEMPQAVFLAWSEVEEALAKEL